MIVLREIRANGFRGIRSGPILNIGPGGLLLLGDNGVGKTSWVDAIEKPLTGKCSSVETGDQTLSWAKHGAHIHSDDPPRVTLIFSDGGSDYEVDLQADSTGLPSSMRALLSAAKQCSFILRRRTLLDFINAKPQDRYQALGSFLNLARYEFFERGLKGILSSLDGQIAARTNDVQRLEATLRVKLGVPVGTPLDSSKILERLTRLFRDAGLAGVDDFSQIVDRNNRATELMDAFGDVQRRGRINALGQQCEGLPAITSIMASTQGLLSAADTSSVEERSLRGVFFADVLSQGLTWISTDKLTNCPLCESPIDFATVKRSVEQRLASHDNLIRLRAAVARARSALVSAINHHLQAFGQVAQEWPRAMANVPQALSDCVTALRSISTKLASSSSYDQFAQVFEDINALRCDEVRGSLIDAVNHEKEGFPDQDRYALLFAARDAGMGSAGTHPQLRVLSLDLSQLQSDREQIIRVIGHAEAGRKAAVQALISRVAGTADSFFQQIHPGEKIGVPLLEVTERGTGSLSLTGEFHGRRGDPRGYYSEGHLDSLGLCLFLAIRRLHHDQHPELNLLVLDDVLHSVDGEHRLRTAKLIIKEFSDHQIVVTTHDRIWFENLKQLTRSRSFKHQKVTSWSVDAGPSISDYAAEYEWLVSSAGRAAPAATRINSAGRILEETLQNLCNNLSIAVPYKLRGDYTIEPLWNSFLSFAKRHAGFMAAAREDLDRIEEIRAVRNFAGAHWNEWAQQLTDAEAEEFCRSVLGLRSLAYCDLCGAFIERIDKLDRVWSCEKEHLRYDPKVTPSKDSAKAGRESAAGEQPSQGGTVPPKRIM
jgi:hypothetical protein